MCVCWGGGGVRDFSLSDSSSGKSHMSLRGCAVGATPVEDLQTRRTLAGDQPHLKGRRNLGDKPTIHHHDPGGRMGVFVVGEAVGRSGGCVLGD